LKNLDLHGHHGTTFVVKVEEKSADIAKRKGDETEARVGLPVDGTSAEAGLT